jgi:hypothetical protein
MAKETNTGYQSFFHKYWVKEIKKRTKATHVGHIEGFYDQDNKRKINCIHIKSKTFELKYGGAKDFSLFTDKDYEDAIESYLTGLKYESDERNNS